MIWIQLDHSTDQWQALVNSVMNLWAPYKISWQAEQLLGFQEDSALWSSLIKNESVHSLHRHLSFLTFYASLYFRVNHFTLHYIPLYLHCLDPKLVNVFVGYEVHHINAKTCVLYNWSFHMRKPWKTYWLHIRLFKNTFTYKLNAVSTTFKWVIIWTVKYSSTEYNEYVFNYHFNYI
jgi:hypothetical protein